MGIKIDFSKVRELAGSGSLGRPHIAQAMLEKGYIRTIKDAFNQYIGRGCPAYVERDKISPVEATRLIIKACGIPVLAHPLTFANPESLIVELVSSGLAGIEAYYSGYSPEQIAEIIKLAKKSGRVATGGSDFHGLDAVNEPPLGTIDVPLEAAERLIALSQDSKVKSQSES
jgi:predicted metal-dependent phosphoesterase TrpH